MTNQKWISILVIALLVGLGGYKYYTWKNPSPQTGMDNHSVTSSEHITSGSSHSSESSNQGSPSVTIHKATPINGKLKGVIEVGASGFNSFVVNMDSDKNWELVSKQFGKSLAYEGFANVDDVAKGLKDYLGVIFEKGVSGRNVHFVMSSGALKNPKTELIAKGIEKMGYVVNRVTATQEGQYAAKALLDAKYRTNSFTVDIGSGNTKISWYEGDRIKSLEGDGAKYYQKDPAPTDAQINSQIAELIKKIPSSNRENCFIIGGVPFELASKSRQGEERFTILGSPDTYSSGDNVKLQKGLVIYRSVFENSGAKNIIFDWDANFTVGFLLTLN